MRTKREIKKRISQFIQYRILEETRTRFLRASYFMALTKRDRHAIRFLLVLICITIALRAWGIVRPAKEWGISDLGNPFAMDNTYLGSRFYQEAATHQETRYGNKDALPSRYPSGCSTNRQKSTENRQKDTSEFPYRSRYTPPSYMVKREFTVDLNKADTFDLQELRGIGSVYSKRIIAYREKLGGFAHPEQLREVWGIDSVLYQRIAPSVYVKDPKLRKLKVNQADLYTLKKHPYLDYYQAKEIYLHRLKYGPFSTIEQIRNVNLMDSGTFSRLYPYLSVEKSGDGIGITPHKDEDERITRQHPEDSQP